MRNKELSKKIALAMVTLMAASSLAGCGGKSNGGATEGKPAQEAVEATEEAGAAEETAEAVSVKTDSGVMAASTGTSAEDILARDFSDPIKISYAGPQCTDGFDYNHGNDYYSWWTDTFNVEWDMTSLTFENWAQRLNTWINADDMPDWCVWNFNAGDAQNYADQSL